MRTLKNLPIPKKLLLINALFVLGFLVSFGISFRTLNQVKVNGPLYRDIVRGKDLVADILPPPEYILESYLVTLQLTQELPADERKQLTERCAALRHDFDERHGYWQTELPPGAIKETLLTKSYTPAIEFYDVLDRQFLPAVAAGDLAAARTLATGPLKSAYDRHRKAIDETVSLAITSASNAEARANSVERLSSRAVVGVTGTLLLVIGVTTLLTARGVSRSLKRLSVSLADEADNMKASAAQISAGAQSLAEGASEQASSLEETSSALEEMAAMSRTTASNAKKALEGAEQARKAAEQGDQTTRQLNGAMAGINDSSTQISKIIKVIEEIAFQTNLLALNAAVEAAHAGEHGKGFAVVAEEVRNLAQRCASAAKDTTNLIEGSVQRAKQGAVTAAEVGQALSAIVTEASKVAELISGISRAADEQAQGVEQVNTAVAQMDQVTQQNSAGAEESASAAEQLAAEAVKVNGIVGELAALVDRRVTAAGEHAARPADSVTAGPAVPRAHTARPPKTAPRQNRGPVSQPAQGTTGPADF